MYCIIQYYIMQYCLMKYFTKCLSSYRLHIKQYCLYNTIQYHSNHDITYNNQHIYQASLSEEGQGFLSILDVGACLMFQI